MSPLNIPPPGMIPPPTITDYLQSPAIGMQPGWGNGKSFHETLTDAIYSSKDTKVRFSSHAQNRLLSRGIQLDRTDLKQLDQAIDMAKEKGSHDSLVLMKGLAFVVNVDQRTVVTAMNDLPSQGGVFTNIDSTIVMS